MVDKLKVIELFAGVGGFRIGLERSNFEVVWSNQWSLPLNFNTHLKSILSDLVTKAIAQKH